MRGLKTLVIIMGVLIVIGVGVVAGAIIDRAARGGARTSAVTAPALAAPGKMFGNVAVDLPQGAKIQEMAAAGERLVLRLLMPDGAERLLVLDPGSGQPLGTIELRPAKP